VLAVLDSEALTALAFPREQGRAGRRAQAVLVAVERLGGRTCVPAPVIAEVARSASRRSGVDWVLRRLPVVDTDRAIATLAGHLLGKNGLDSCHAVDAFVAATALGASPAVVLTGDPEHLGRLVGDDPGVHVRPLP
jgi:predicted nucleic acid-binding protein